MKTKKFVITKKIAKHGNQAVIIVPKILSGEIKPGSVAKVTIDIIKA